VYHGVSGAYLTATHETTRPATTSTIAGTNIATTSMKRAFTG
jgi:hypothetical protein